MSDIPEPTDYIDLHALPPHVRVELFRKELAELSRKYGVIPAISDEQIRPDFHQSQIRYVALGGFNGPVEQKFGAGEPGDGAETATPKHPKTVARAREDKSANKQVL